MALECYFSLGLIFEALYLALGDFLRAKLISIWLFFHQKSPKGQKPTQKNSPQRKKITLKATFYPNCSRWSDRPHWPKMFSADSVTEQSDGKICSNSTFEVARITIRNLEHQTRTSGLLHINLGQLFERQFHGLSDKLLEKGLKIVQHTGLKLTFIDTIFTHHQYVITYRQFG